MRTLVALAAFCFVASVLLSYAGKRDAFIFAGCGLILALWAPVVTSRSGVSAKDVISLCRCLQLRRRSQKPVRTSDRFRQQASSPMCTWSVDSRRMLRSCFGHMSCLPVGCGCPQETSYRPAFRNRSIWWFAVFKRHSRIRSIIGPESNAVLVGIRGKCVCEGLRVNQQRLSL